MSKLERSHDAQVRQQNIAALLLLLARSVHHAKQQNRKGWTIAKDLATMKTLLTDLEALDQRSA